MYCLNYVVDIDYTCISTIHKPAPTTAKSIVVSKDDPEYYVAGLPVVSFRLTDEFKKEYPKVQQASVSTLLRVKGWILPNYPCPPNEEKTEILRAVIRESFSASRSLRLLANADLVDKLVEDIIEVTETLMSADEVDLQAFAHPDIKPSLNERLSDGPGKWGGWGKWGKGKADEFRAKMNEQRQTGVFKRAAC
jgi:hypothetical protein